eukprot:g1598.t1
MWGYWTGCVAVSARRLLRGPNSLLASGGKTGRGAAKLGIRGGNKGGNGAIRGRENWEGKVWLEWSWAWSVCSKFSIKRRSSYCNNNTTNESNEYHDRFLMIQAM